MRNIDPKSLCIGFLGAALIFTITGAKQKKNLGDIVVNSITVLDDGYGGFITAYNQDQKRTLYLVLVRKTMDIYKHLINFNSLQLMLVLTKTWMVY